jgi:hypothetical protein
MRSGRPVPLRSRWAWAGIALCFALLLTVAAAAPPSEVGVPVTSDGQVLFWVHGSYGPFGAEERATVTEKRLRIASDPVYSQGLFSIRMNGATAEAFYRGQLVGSSRPEDGEAAGKGSAQERMNERLRIVQDAIAFYRARRVATATRTSRTRSTRPGWRSCPRTTPRCPTATRAPSRAARKRPRSRRPTGEPRTG